jgi:hypothetical protein
MNVLLYQHISTYNTSRQKNNCGSLGLYAKLSGSWRFNEKFGSFKCFLYGSGSAHFYPIYFLGLDHPANDLPGSKMVHPVVYFSDDCFWGRLLLAKRVQCVHLEVVPKPCVRVQLCTPHCRVQPQVSPLFTTLCKLYTCGLHEATQNVIADKLVG